MMGSANDVAARVDAFWFGEPGSPEDGNRRAVWFSSSPEFDAAIREQFLGTHEQAAAGGLDALRDTAAGCLALVILLDQFPRNMFRGSPRAFATDAMALAVAEHAIANGFDQDVTVLRRKFLYLPFEHAEDMAHQERCIALFRAAGDEDGVEWAVKHRDIVARFGRFPHRNAVLGRPSTAEEIEFLKQPGSSF